jgi:hypothetical protein
MEMLDKYPLATVLSGVGIIIGFLMPFVFLLALIPEVYLVTRSEPEVKQNAAFLIGATIILFIVMFLIYSLF